MGEEPDEVEGAGAGGARVSSDEAEVRIRESTLSRAEEERAPVVRYLRAAKSVYEPQKTTRPSVGSSGFAPYRGCDGGADQLRHPRPELAARFPEHCC